MYLRESPIWKGEGGFLVCADSIQTLFYGLTKGQSNLCDTEYLITSSSTSKVKSIGLPALGSSLVHMDIKTKLNVEYLKIDPNLMKNTENLLNQSWISNSGR